MTFGMVRWNQIMEKKQNYVTWIQTALQSKWKQDIHVDVAKDVEKRFDTSNYDLGRQLPRGKKQKSKWVNENNDRFCCLESKNI